MPSALSINELLQNVQQLSTKEFEQFFQKVKEMRPHEANVKVSSKERRLLAEIRAGLPRDLKRRFDYLIARRDAGMIHENEFQELQQLTMEVEKHDLRRLECLAQLAELHQASLPEVIELFNIRPEANG